MNSFILDCSVYMSWCLNEQAGKVSLKILDAIKNCRVVVPALWLYEVSNTLAVSVSRKKISVADANGLINDVKLLPIAIDKPALKEMANIFHIANEHQMSAYDAAYVELALRTHFPIASFDRKVVRVSKKMGLTIFEG